MLRSVRSLSLSTTRWAARVSKFLRGGVVDVEEGHRFAGFRVSGTGEAGFLRAGERGVSGVLVGDRKRELTSRDLGRRGLWE